MTKNDKPSGTNAVDEKLHMFVGDDMIGCHVDIPDLTEQEIKLLWEIIEGKHRPSWKLNEKRAFSALARNDPGKDTADFLAGKLLALDQPDDVRMAAAYFLGKLPGEISESPLLRVVTEGPLMVQREAIESLGRVGSARAEKLLADLDLENDAPASIGRQRDAALFAIALRTKNKKVADASFERLDAPSWEALATRTMKPSEIKDAIKRLGEGDVDISIDEKVGISFPCAGVDHYLLVNQEWANLLKPKASATLPFVAAIIAAAHIEAHYLSKRWTIIAKPQAEKFDLIAIRQSGAVVFVGSARIASDVIHFEVRDAGMQRNPVRGQGQLKDGKLNLSLETRENIQKGKSRPRFINGAERIGQRNRELNSIH